MGFLSEARPQLLGTTPRWFVVDKPAGWLTVPPVSAEADPRPVLADWVRRNWGEAHVVHRLDVETSGVLLLARTIEAHREAGLWFQKHQIKKTYHALALGAPISPVMRIHSLVRGSAAVTQVEVKERFPGANAFLAQLTPTTGRRHQIRIHLASKGHPLLGDRDYGGPVAVTLGDRSLPIARVALHAARLQLPGGESFEAPWAADFTHWVGALREARGTR